MSEGTPDEHKAVVLVTGAAGRDAQAACRALASGYRVIGMDHPGRLGDGTTIPVDLAVDASVTQALRTLRDAYGGHLAGVVHFAQVHRASGNDDDLTAVNVDETRRLLRQLARFKVDQFIIASTMLVEASAGVIDENAPVEPSRAYAASMAVAEEAVRSHRGAMPSVILRLARRYDDETVDPLLARRIAAIRERDPAAHVSVGSTATRQATLHRDDLAGAVRRLLDQRSTIPPNTILLLGEPDPPAVAELQDRIGQALHGERWPTLPVPVALGGLGNWFRGGLRSHLPVAIGGTDEARSETVADDAAGEDFVLDISQAVALLDWQPRRRLTATLPTILRRLKRDPRDWYAANGLPWQEPA